MPEPLLSVTITAREQAELIASPPDERPLAPTEVEGRTLATLISAGTELASAYQGSTFPAVPGYAAVFEVENVGSEVGPFKPGDRAFCMGGHRSRQRVPAANALPLPEGIDPRSATFARMMGVPMATLTTTTARPPQKVLVTGLGLVGNLGSLIFQRCGYDVIACDPHEGRRKIAEDAGVKRVLSGVPLDDPSLVGEIALAIECSGHEGAALAALKIVRKRGEVVLIGTPWRKRTDHTAHEITHAVFHRYVVLRSGWEWEVPLHPEEFRSNSIHGNIAAALGWIADGSIRVDGLYTAVPPARCQEAYHDLLHQRPDRLGIVFDWTQA